MGSGCAVDGRMHYAPHAAWTDDDFRVNAESGEICLAKSLDTVRVPVRQLLIQATDKSTQHIIYRTIRLIVRFFAPLIDWSMDRLIDWLIDWSIDWLIDWLNAWMRERFLGQLIDWLTYYPLFRLRSSTRLYGLKLHRHCFSLSTNEQEFLKEVQI